MQRLLNRETLQRAGVFNISDVGVDKCLWHLPFFMLLAFQLLLKHPRFSFTDVAKKGIRPDYGQKYRSQGRETSDWFIWCSRLRTHIFRINSGSQSRTCKQFEGKSDQINVQSWGFSQKKQKHAWLIFLVIKKKSKNLLSISKWAKQEDQETELNILLSFTFETGFSSSLFFLPSLVGGGGV